MSESEQGVAAQPSAAAPGPIDTAALARWLQEAVADADFSGPLELEKFKGGQSNPTYRLTAGGRHYVLRTRPGPAARLLPSAHAVEREFRVMQALADTDVPVPRMLALCEDESVIGRAFYLMEYKEGRILWDQALPGQTAAQRGAVYDEMNRVLAALHKVDHEALMLGDYGRAGSYFERQIARWSKQYRASQTQTIAYMDQLIEWLPANIPASAQADNLATIVHGDYRLDNLMFDSDAPEVVAVLDWELSTIGHPFADFSYHCMSWHIPSGVFRGIADLDLETLGIPDEQSYIARYCERTGFVSADELTTDWNFYLAYNLFRIAAIVQGVARRAEQGLASSESAGDRGNGVTALAGLAWHKAMQKGRGRVTG